MPYGDPRRGEKPLPGPRAIPRDLSPGLRKHLRFLGGDFSLEDRVSFRKTTWFTVQEVRDYEPGPKNYVHASLVRDIGTVFPSLRDGERGRVIVCAFR